MMKRSQISLSMVQNTLRISDIQGIIPHAPVRSTLKGINSKTHFGGYYIFLALLKHKLYLRECLKHNNVQLAIKKNIITSSKSTMPK